MVVLKLTVPCHTHPARCRGFGLRATHNVRRKKRNHETDNITSSCDTLQERVRNDV